MGVALTVTCDAEGCRRHFVVSQETGDFEDLHATGTTMMWIEIAIRDLPPYWRVEGGLDGVEFRALCAEHA